MSVFGLLHEYGRAFLSGVTTTAALSLIVWFAGLFFGGLLGILAARYASLGRLSQVIGFLVGSIPVIVILVWFYYPAQVLAGITVSPFSTAAFALSLVNIVVVAELVRPAITGLPNEYLLVGRVCGMPGAAVLRRIAFPLVIRQLIPSLLLSQVIIMQATLFASLISVEEIFRVTQEINAQVYQPVELYTALALFFLLVSAPINGLALYLRHLYSRDFSEA